MTEKNRGTKRQRTKQDLEKELDVQIGYLERSCEAFDKGHESEAKRLASVLRTLLHDTGKCHSLLGQLNKKKAPFCNSAAELDPKNLAISSCLVCILVSDNTALYFAPLDDRRMKHCSFDEWWETEVFREPGRASLTRKDLILTATNQDGGGHFDPELDEPYARFALDDDYDLQVIDGAKLEKIHGQVEVAIRQIAHEVLKTLKLGYAKKPNLGNGASGWMLTEFTLRLATNPKVPRPSAARLGIDFTGGSGRMLDAPEPSAKGLSATELIAMGLSPMTHVTATFKSKPVGPNPSAVGPRIDVAMQLVSPAALRSAMELCPCGGGKKFKECHGKADA